MIDPTIRELEWRTSINGSARAKHSPSGPRVILLFTRDRALDQLVAEALLGSSAIVLIARNVSDAIQIVCGRGRDLQLVVLDLDHECRGLTLLNAVHTCYHDLPVLITAERDEERFRTLALANGARACLNKPVQVATLATAIRELNASHQPHRTH